MNTHQQYTVLIVEDASHDREMYRRFLNANQDCTYTILEEDSAEAGLAICRTHEIDGILLDFLLPDATGLEFLESLKAQQANFLPPVVMITGQGNEAIAARAIKSGAEDYLIKSQITPSSLQVALLAAISHARLRRQLQHSEARFHTSVENMLDCFGIFPALRSPSGTITDFRMEYLNAAALADLHLTRAEIGNGLCQQFPIFLENGLFTEYCHVVETGQPLVKEALECTRKGDMAIVPKFYDLRVTKLEDGFVASWRDVTARQHADLVRQKHMERERIVSQMTQQIRRSLDLQEILQTTVTEVRRFLNCDRVFIYQFETGTVGHVTVEAIADSPFSILEKSLEDPCFLLVTHAPEPHLAHVQAIADVRKAAITRSQLDCLDRCLVRASLEVPIFQGDRLWGVLVANQCHAPRQWAALDTELLQSLAAQVGIAIYQADLLAQAQAARIAAEQANRAKDELLAVVSHELRSPLTTVLGWAKLLQTRTLDPNVVQQALKTIERSTQTQTQLIEDLLDVSRMIHGTLRLDMAPVNLIQVVETTIANLRLVAEAKAIDLKCQLPSTELIVMGDAHRLQQIITNLLTNAIKFTSESGKVTISLEAVSQEDTAMARLCVTDTGKGIASDFLPHIFKQFFQAETLPSRYREGLGLGLAIVHRLVELHQGTITASSPGEGQGATFTVYFPLTSSPQFLAESGMPRSHSGCDRGSHPRER